MSNVGHKSCKLCKIYLKVEKDFESIKLSNISDMQR